MTVNYELGILNVNCFELFSLSFSVFKFLFFCCFCFLFVWFCFLQMANLTRPILSPPCIEYSAEPGVCRGSDKLCSSSAFHPELQNSGF